MLLPLAGFPKFFGLNSSDAACAGADDAPAPPLVVESKVVAPNAAAIVAATTVRRMR